MFFLCLIHFYLYHLSLPLSLSLFLSLSLSLSFFLSLYHFSPHHLPANLSPSLYLCLPVSGNSQSKSKNSHASRSRTLAGSCEVVNWSTGPLCELVSYISNLFLETKLKFQHVSLDYYVTVGVSSNKPILSFEIAVLVRATA